MNEDRRGIDYIGASLPAEAGYSRRLGDIHEQEKGSHTWLVTFTDVIALMLTFFVLLFSMAKPASEEWADVSAALQAQFGKFEGVADFRGPQDFIDIQKISFSKALNMDYLEALLQDEIGENEDLRHVVLVQRERSLVISLPHEFLFDEGSDSVGEEGGRALYTLGGILSRIGNRIEVEGHAAPPEGVQGTTESNWSLSLTRAANVAAALEKVGYRRDIAVHGFSDGHYEDMRVDIVVMDHDGSRSDIVPDPAP